MPELNLQDFIPLSFEFWPDGTLPISCVFLEANKLNRTQKHHLHIVLTPKQYQLLSDNAQKCGITKRLFIVRLLEGTEVKARPSQEIKELRTEIHHIGNNIKEGLIKKLSVNNRIW